ncbi:MAG: sigma-70 family RNA polymerase sigma factor [Alphaproteobacteria bacterium]|nr:sigma-70 family RNA polymerase sigma factor [Alphaproteobacteria bacterium]MCB9688117.1 sigma-70 family RNA polymerase sigma factor [Alphaproteobacteria bacterium]
MDPLLHADHPLLRGDPRAFDEAFAAFREPVWRFLLRLSGRTEVADELLQETFLRLASHARRLRPDTNLRAWLFTVARNLWRSHRRWAWLDGVRLAELAAQAVRGSTPTPLELAAATDTARRVEQALAEMPDKLREVALLVLIEHLEPSEAATVLSLSPEAVRQRLARARRILSDAVGGEP